MPGNGHVQFGERAEETDQPKGWNRASVRLHARAGRPHVATWAEAGVVTAADEMPSHRKCRCPGR
jgi:hypothetical protein